MIQGTLTVEDDPDHTVGRRIARCAAHVTAHSHG
jgi:hypothetical protein